MYSPAEAATRISLENLNCSLRIETISFLFLTREGGGLANFHSLLSFHLLIILVVQRVHLEQRRDTEEPQGKNIHIHLLFFLDGKKPSNAKREVERNVKHLCDTSFSTVYNVRRCKDDD
jgi:hypothetical protein